MAASLGHLFDARVVRSIASDLRRADPRFDEMGFVEASVRGLAPLALTARGAHVGDVLRRFLPGDTSEALAVLERSLEPIAADGGLGPAPFRYLAHAAFVGRHGLADFEGAMRFQHALTQRFTAEWSIRSFLEHRPDETLARLRVWASDPSVHVRRLVSEGSRPRLPWAPRLERFVRDPSPTIELLERLKDDPERYVQRSVANHLNDIAKDHPARAAALGAAWMRGASASRRYVVTHGLRTLVKAGDPAALSVLGAGEKPRVRVQKVVLSPRRVPIGEKLRLSFDVVGTSRKEQALVVDYAVHFVKKRGTTAKVFKLKRVTLGPGARVTCRGTVSFAVHSTRKPSPGKHTIEARINGVVFPLGAVAVVAAL